MTQDRSISVPVRALAFDVDGTIANTDPIHAEAWCRALKSVNGREFELKDYLEACINGAMTPRQFLAAYCDAGDWAKIEDNKRRLYPDLLAQRAVLTPGLVELLTTARSAGVTVAIVSSSSRSSVDALLNGPWLSALPDVVVARGDAASSKPSPEPYRTAVRQLRVSTELVIAFEDSASGVVAAEGAGLKCIQVGLTVPALTEIQIGDFRECRIGCVGSLPHLTVRAR